MWIGAGVAAAAAMLICSAPAQAGSMKVHRVTPVSGPTPFSGCPFDAPPPFEDAAFQPKDTAVEPDIAIDPHKPSRMAAAWMQDFTGGNMVASTGDGGKTWHRSVPPNLGTCSGADSGTSADPHLAYGADGALYLVSMRRLVLSPGRTTPDNEVAVSKSTDNGRTWGQPVVVQGRDGYNDYPFIATDPDDPDRVYVTFTKATEPVGNALFTMFSVSEDGGRTFGAPKAIHRADDMVAYYSAGSLRTQKGGKVLLLLWNYDGINYLPGVGNSQPNRIRALVSGDHGTTWARPVTVGVQSPIYNATDPETGESLRTGNPHAAATPDGGWYVVWHDVDADGTGSRMNIARGHADGSWGQPREVLPWSDRQIFFPMVAVTPEGTVGITWYDSRNDGTTDGKYLIDAFLAVSRDGGASFSPLHLAGPMNLREGWSDARTFSGAGQRFLGDYMGMAARPKGFVAALAFTSPVSDRGMSQLFVADVREKTAGKSRRR